jgi:hypothetical protein
MRSFLPLFAQRAYVPASKMPLYSRKDSLSTCLCWQANLAGCCCCKFLCLIQQETSATDIERYESQARHVSGATCLLISSP